MELSVLYQQTSPYLWLRERITTGLIKYDIYVCNNHHWAPYFTDKYRCHVSDFLFLTIFCMTLHYRQERKNTWSLTLQKNNSQVLHKQNSSSSHDGEKLIWGPTAVQYFFPIIYDTVTLLHFISSSALAGPHCLLVVIHGWWERFIKYRFKTVQVTLSKHLADHFSSKYQLLCQDIHHLCLTSAPDAAQPSDWPNNFIFQPVFSRSQPQHSLSAQICSSVSSNMQHQFFNRTLYATFERAQCGRQGICWASCVCKASISLRISNPLLVKALAPNKYTEYN